MKIERIYVELEKLHKGESAFADVELDLEDEKITLIRVPLSPRLILTGSLSNSQYLDPAELQSITEAKCYPLIKEHVGEVVSNKLFENMEKLSKMIS